MPIDPSYMSPNLRWGLFMLDHPGAPDPTYELVSIEESGVPAEFLRDSSGGPVTGFVRCTLRDGTGAIVAQDDKEIPTAELLRNGKVEPFKRNAENWRKLRTMALGRALKTAGYPDRTDDLKAFLLYRQRLAELGGPMAPSLPSAAAAAALEGPQHDPETGEVYSEVTTHEDVTLDAEAAQDEPAEAELVDDEEDDGTQRVEVVGWPEELSVALAQLPADKQAEIVKWATAVAYTPEVLQERSAARNQLLRRIRQAAGAEAGA